MYTILIKVWNVLFT